MSWERAGVNLRNLLDCKANIDFAYQLYTERGQRRVSSIPENILIEVPLDGTTVWRPRSDRYPASRPAWRQASRRTG
jgi:hypothetical protein